MGDYQYRFARPFFGCRPQSLLAPFPDHVAIFPPGRAEVPTCAHLFIEQLRLLVLKLRHGLARPASPGLLTEPRVGNNMNLQERINKGSGLEGTARVARDNPGPLIAFQNPPPLFRLILAFDL